VRSACISGEVTGAAFVLSLLLPAQATGLDVESLGHPARAVRERAIESLAAGDVAVPELLVHLERNPAVRHSLLEVLARRKDPAALPALARHADGADPAVGESAAAAVVATAFARGLDLESLDSPAMARLARRLSRATDREVRVRLGALGKWGHLDKTRRYRPFLAGGRYSRRALIDAARDPALAEVARNNALHALALLAGDAAEPVFRALIDDPMPRVRVAAASMLFQIGTDGGREFLAARLEQGRFYQEQELGWMVAAAERVRRLGPQGTRRLSRLVATADHWRALGAAAALARTRPEVARAVLARRLGPLLDTEERRPGSAMESALFEFRVGPLEKSLREKMLRSGHPLVRVPALADRGTALAEIEPMIAPPRSLGSREPLRVRIVYHLLRRHRAQTDAWFRFGSSALDSQVAASRRYALWALGRVPAARRGPLLPRIERLLADSYESVRLAAAELLAPDPRALRVAAWALYDGDPRSVPAVKISRLDGKE